MGETTVEAVLSEIGSRLVALRKSRGYENHEEFAISCNLPPGHYWRLERGQVNFTMKTFLKILIAHNITLEQFFVDGEGEQIVRMRK